METCEVGGCRLAHVRRGDRGPVLLLVHGFPLDHSMWRFQIEQFAERRPVHIAEALAAALALAMLSQTLAAMSR